MKSIKWNNVLLKDKKWKYNLIILNEDIDHFTICTYQGPQDMITLTAAFKKQTENV